ncbi:MAG TPA: TonB-dependent receptor plug domain-containing protein, partial [Blastocatellia bacterium]|nr:TonB-dependent receptor plug domain-containing protein [Blastocatellia bacterium]
MNSIHWLVLVFGCALAVNAQSTDLSGIVKDVTGAPMTGIPVSLINSRQSVLATAVTGEEGRFTLRGVLPGGYEILVDHHGFAPGRWAVQVPARDGAELILTLRPGVIAEAVTVTADLGLVQSVDQTAQQVNVIGERQLLQRAPSVLAQAAAEEPGLQLQRTSSTIGGIFVRGLTGAKVLVFVDGVRFSTSAMRGGINTFFNLNDASNLRTVEVLRGPNGAQFGSDSLGGSVHLISRTPIYSAGRTELHGQLNTGYDSADHGFGGNTLMTVGTRNLALLVNQFAHRSNTLRSGGGFDTHAAVARFFGIRSDLFGERSTDTAFTQYGGLIKLNYKPGANEQLSVHYNRSQLDGGKRFDQTLGGDGNLIADLRNFMLDFLYGRYERFDAGPFDAVAISY